MITHTSIPHHTIGRISYPIQSPSFSFSQAAAAHMLRPWPPVPVPITTAFGASSAANIEPASPTPEDNDATRSSAPPNNDEHSPSSDFLGQVIPSLLPSSAGILSASANSTQPVGYPRPGTGGLSNIANNSDSGEDSGGSLPSVRLSANQPFRSNTTSQGTLSPSRAALCTSEDRSSAHERAGIPPSASSPPSAASPPILSADKASGGSRRAHKRCRTPDQSEVPRRAPAPSLPYAQPGEDPAAPASITAPQALQVCTETALTHSGRTSSQ